MCVRQFSCNRHDGTAHGEIALGMAGRFRVRQAPTAPWRIRNVVNVDTEVYGTLLRVGHVGIRRMKLPVIVCRRGVPIH